MPGLSGREGRGGFPGEKRCRRIFFFSAVDLRRAAAQSFETLYAAMEPPSKKMRKLLDEDSDSGDDAGGVPIGKSPGGSFKINEDYAKRFEHNKKREEVQKRMDCPESWIHGQQVTNIDALTS